MDCSPLCPALYPRRLELPRMTTETLLPGHWSRRKWLAGVALVCGLQVGLLFCLGDAKPKPLGSPGPASILRMAGGGAGELLALMDPTLFALPHRQNFSGPGWLLVQPQQFEPYVWSNPPGWLELTVAGLGEPFQRFIATNVFDAARVLPESQPELTWPVVTRAHFLPTHSTFRLTDDLAQRRTLSSLELPSQANAELLTNSVVRLVVDPAGMPITQTLLISSGSKEADQYALEQARTVRFEPANKPGKYSAAGGLSWGELIFEWHTIPQLTNAAATVP
jgi:TonB family protein